VFVRDRLLLLAVSTLDSDIGDAVADGIDRGAVTNGAEGYDNDIDGRESAPDDGKTPEGIRGDDPEAVGMLGEEEFDIGKGALSELGVGKKLDPPVPVLSGMLSGAVYSGMLPGTVYRGRELGNGYGERLPAVLLRETFGRTLLLSEIPVVRGAVINGIELLE